MKRCERQRGNTSSALCIQREEYSPFFSAKRKSDLISLPFRKWNGKFSELKRIYLQGNSRFPRPVNDFVFKSTASTILFLTIQSCCRVRENGMDMTGWLDYFITGLETQMVEIKERGEQVIRRDVLVQKYNLNDRQSKALGFLLQNAKLTIQDFEGICRGVNRRSLQRDIKDLLNKVLVISQGATHLQEYKLA